jgi:hypothetical protein
VAKLVLAKAKKQHDSGVMERFHYTLESVTIRTENEWIQLSSAVVVLTEVARNSSISVQSKATPQALNDALAKLESIARKERRNTKKSCEDGNHLCSFKLYDTEPATQGRLSQPVPMIKTPGGVLD